MWEALEEVQDDIEGSDLAIFGVDGVSSFSTFLMAIIILVFMDIVLL